MARVSSILDYGYGRNTWKQGRSQVEGLGGLRQRDIVFRSLNYLCYKLFLALIGEKSKLLNPIAKQRHKKNEQVQTTILNPTEQHIKLD